MYLATVKELVDFCNKWLNETSDKLTIADLDRILTTLLPASHTAGFICAAAARLLKLRSDTDFIEFLERLEESIFKFTSVQIQWIQEICNFFYSYLI